jgi:hypothetical protein
MPGQNRIPARYRNAIPRPVESHRIDEVSPAMWSR